MRKKRKTNSIFSQQLRARRAISGRSAQQLADATGISVITYYNYEQGRCAPSLDTFERLALAFNCDPSDLLSPTLTLSLKEGTNE